jgi:IS5 family transposase
MLWLSACATGGSDRTGQVCPPVVDYSAAELARATSEVEAQPDGAMIVRMLLEAAFATVLERAERILEQQKDDKVKLYAFHAPEVECIGKGKARTRYEFGCKTSIATTNERCKGGQFVLGAIALPGNPYDGHSLAGQIDQVVRLTGTSVARAYVDRGYCGHKIDRDGLDITISHTRGILEKKGNNCTRLKGRLKATSSSSVMP